MRAEVWIVLGLSLGQSAVYSVVSLARKLSEGPLRDSTATLNPSRDTVPWLDLTYQLLSIGFALVPVALALYLLSLDDAPPVLRRLGLDGSRPWRDLGFGAALAAVIGIPGLGVYFGGRALGVTANIVTSPEDLYWWSVTILVLSALQNALLEEVIVVGYLMTRLKQFGWGLPAIIATSALLRGSYHLYQGFGQFVGNVAMGVVFAWWFQRTGRVMPLVIAHTILDVVAFVGYALFADAIGLR
nr:CPBP family intramembrane glutamic endopeptidase [Aeromicrobium phoceense]